MSNRNTTRIGLIPADWSLSRCKTMTNQWVVFSPSSTFLFWRSESALNCRCRIPVRETTRTQTADMHRGKSSDYDQGDNLYFLLLWRGKFTCLFESNFRLYGKILSSFNSQLLSKCLRLYCYFPSWRLKLNWRIVSYDQWYSALWSRTIHIYKFSLCYTDR